MHLTELMLQHFRGAADVQIRLDTRLNVFYGSNGTGKSTVLDAVAVALSWLVNRIKTSAASGRPIREIDIRNGQPSARIRLCGEHIAIPFAANVVNTRKGREVMERSQFDLHAVIQSLQEEMWRPNDARLPLLAFYDVHRAVLDIPLRIRKRHAFDPLSANEGALASGTNFRTFFEWFREREDIENERLRTLNQQHRSVRNTEYLDPQLDAVRQAVQQFMPDFCEPTVRRNPLRMEVTKDGTTLQIDQLSNGEKCLMAMVGDIARRLAIANPVAERPLEGNGIILIDEIDLHLHPTWQSNVVPQLVKTFPHCQFLVSTHSPLVLTNVQPHQLFSLTMDRDGIGVEHPNESYGKNADRVLEDLMGVPNTRPSDVETKLRKLFGLIADSKLAPAKAAYESLRKEIGNDPALARAETLIRMKETARR